MKLGFDRPWFGLTNLVSSIILLFILGQAAAVENFSDELNQTIEDSIDEQDPGLSIIVVKEGEVIFHRARGMGNIEHEIPLQTSSVFRIGSITKQFTAAAIMMLVEEGKLSIEDDINKYLPDYPTHGHTITIGHLLTHTSGIKSYTGIPGYMAAGVQVEVTVEELIEVFADRPMDFAPGEQFRYNNSGYVLLGAIIEELSEQDYASFIQERIFDPLEMNQSYYGSHQTIIPKRASGYHPAESGYVNAPYLSMTQPYSAGSLLSTTEDLAKWNAALFAGKVVSEESLDKMLASFALNDGTTAGQNDSGHYGFGLGISSVEGRPAVSHGGGIHGFSTYGLYLPDEDIYVAVLCNSVTPAINPARLAGKLRFRRVTTKIQIDVSGR